MASTLYVFIYKYMIMIINKTIYLKPILLTIDLATSL